MKDARAKRLAEWARATDPLIPVSAELKPVSDDASFRRYFRFTAGAEGKIFVDAPPEHEDNESFVKISRALCRSGLQCPVVLAADLELGYMAISDLGDTVYLSEMLKNPGRVDQMYREALDALLQMMFVDCELPLYDEAKLRSEMSLFNDWFLSRQLGISITESTGSMLASACDLMVSNALEQPQRFVHRDYHCRNLMLVENNGPGILDFQDAVIGPVTYDLVSLYKDCYYRFDRPDVLRAVEAFRRRLVSKGVVNDNAPVLRWFDLMGAQRHLKCAGIFSRLNLRDGKPGYLADIPLVVDYLVEVCAVYPELSDFGCWLKDEVVPRLDQPEFRK